jgi:hypothetical protein
VRYLSAVLNRRSWAIGGSIVLGIILVGLACLLHRSVCHSWQVDSGGFCGAVARTPPWTLLTSIASAPALTLLWLWRTLHKDQEIAQKQRELELSQQEKRASHFAEAVRLLAAERMESRLGAIYSLESLALVAEEQRSCVVETLCAFLRVHGTRAPDLRMEWLGDWKQPEDVQAAFTVVGRLPRKQPLDLRRAQLPCIEGVTANLEKALLLDANLAGACLYDANLTGALLSRSNLIRAYLSSAKLDGATLDNADVRGADLHNASLGGTLLQECKYSVGTHLPPHLIPETSGMRFTDDRVDSDGHPVE